MGDTSEMNEPYRACLSGASNRRVLASARGTEAVSAACCGLDSNSRCGRGDCTGRGSECGSGLVGLVGPSADVAFDGGVSGSSTVATAASASAAALSSGLTPMAIRRLRNLSPAIHSAVPHQHSRVSLRCTSSVREGAQREEGWCYCSTYCARHASRPLARFRPHLLPTDPAAAPARRTPTQPET